MKLKLRLWRFPSIVIGTSMTRWIFHRHWKDRIVDERVFDFHNCSRSYGFTLGWPNYKEAHAWIQDLQFWYSKQIKALVGSIKVMSNCEMIERAPRFLNLCLIEYGIGSVEIRNTVQIELWIGSGWFYF